MIATVDIRPARVDELDDVALVWHASASAADDAPPRMSSVEDLRARIDVELADGWTLFVASLAGEVVGVLAMKKIEGVLDQLYVSPSTQRGTIGAQLLGRARAEMPNGFTLRTASANRGARAFYKRMGLKLLSEGVHPRHGHPVCFYGWSVD